MIKENPFDIHAQEYDRWYEEHLPVYESELEAIRELLPTDVPEKSIEIGAGTGRFTSALGISYALDPSRKMLEIAGKNGAGRIQGVTEELPLKSSSMELVLMATSLCFVNAERALREIYRVLAPGGKLVVAFIERDSPLGKEYQKKASKSSFYRGATFHSAAEIIDMLHENGFHEPAIRQTLFRPLSEIKVAEKPEEGFERGSFVVIRTTSIKKE